MPAVGFPVVLDEWPSEFDHYYFVLLDKEAQGETRQDNVVEQLAARMSTSDAYE